MPKWLWPRSRQLLAIPGKQNGTGGPPSGRGRGGNGGKQNNSKAGGTNPIVIDQISPLTNTGSQDLATSSFATLPTAGAVIIVPIASYPSSAGTVTDNQGNTYTRLVTSSTGAGSTSSIWYSTVIGAPSGTFTVTVNFAGNNYYSFRAVSVLGLAAASYADQSAASSGTGTTHTTGSITPTQGNAILFAVNALNDAGSETVVSPWNELYDVTSAAFQVGEADYRIVSLQAAYTCQWTTPNTGGANVIGSFKAA